MSSPQRKPTILPFRVLQAFFALVLVANTVSDALRAQSAAQVQERTANKPAVAPSRTSTADKPKVRGETFVALASGLEDVNQGRPPGSLLELKMLEQQQSLVAEKIERVTVNVQQGLAQGSGVIITPDGYVLTAAHVAGAPGRKAWLHMHDGTRVEALTMGMNRNRDAGLLRIVEGQRSTPWPYATLGQVGSLRRGQWVVASGHPGGWDQDRGAVIRVGRVLKISSSRNKEGQLRAHTLLTDCALIGGDSGGPLFDLEGHLVGIHSRIGTNVDDNMHVPVDVFSDSWDRMVNSETWGQLPGFRPVIGVEGTDSDSRALIKRVEPDGPAQRAGIQPGDLVIAFDGDKISTFSDLKMKVEATMPGDTIVLTIMREQNLLRIPVVVGIPK